MKKGYKICPHCGKEIKSVAIKCQYCLKFLDEKLEKKTRECPFCLNEIGVDESKCPFCDEILNKEGIIGDYIKKYKLGSRSKINGLKKKLSIKYMLIFMILCIILCIYGIYKHNENKKYDTEKKIWCIEKAQEFIDKENKSLLFYSDIEDIQNDVKRNGDICLLYYTSSRVSPEYDSMHKNIYDLIGKEFIDSCDYRINLDDDSNAFEEYEKCVKKLRNKFDKM